MKIEVGYFMYDTEKYVTEWIDLPKRFKFYFKKDESEYTDNEWDKLEQFRDWLECQYGYDVEIHSIKRD